LPHPDPNLPDQLSGCSQKAHSRWVLPSAVPISSASPSRWPDLPPRVVTW